MYLNGGALDGVRVLRPEVVAAFTRRQDAALSHRALGWETPTGQNSAGRRLSAAAFGHTGFTGTSLWVDPQRDLFVILLTNRVNPTRQNTKIGSVRARLADAVAAAVAPGATPLPPSPSTSGR
jgi:CubicO group peptidase (beta-lactamase class C family)